MRASLNAAEAKANSSGAHIVMIGILPTLMPEHLSGRLDERVDALPGAQRLDLHRPRRGHPDRHRRPGTAEPAYGVDRAGVGVHQHAIAPAGLPRRVRAQLERRAGAGRARSWRSAPTRRTSSATSCGPRPASSCSRRPPTPGPTSSRPRACGRGSGSASAGSRRSSTCSRRTCATSRRCCPSCPTRTRWPSWPPGARHASPELRLHNGTIYRWNRPVYDVVDGRPHLRVENRVLPAGPDRRRHDGQLGLLLRHAADAVRRGPADSGRR